MTTLRNLSLVASAALLMASAPVALALPTYSATFQGVTFTFTQTDSDTLTFDIANADAATGDWAGVNFLGAFDFKNLGLDFSSVTATANGLGATNLAGLNSQLSAANIDCSKSTGQQGTICFDVDPDVALASDMLYTIDFSSPLSIGTAGVHLQIVLTNTEGGNKVGSLYSEYVGLSSSSGGGGGSSGSNVPEPATLALLGAALAAMGLFRRRVRMTA